MGGKEEQDLLSIDRRLHREFHLALDQNLHDAGFRLHATGGVGNGRDDWLRSFRQNRGSQDRAIDVLLDTARDFDAVHDTDLLKAARRNLKLGNIQRP